MTDAPNDDLQKFLYDFVESLEDLKILGWLRQREDETPVSTGEVARATGAPDLMVSEVLERLAAKGLLAKTAEIPATFRYAAPTPEFSRTLDLVLERYEADALEILRIMSANAIERVRVTASRTFAEALRDRGPKRD